MAIGSSTPTPDLSDLRHSADEDGADIERSTGAPPSTGASAPAAAVTPATPATRISPFARIQPESVEAPSDPPGAKGPAAPAAATPPTAPDQSVERPDLAEANRIFAEFLRAPRRAPQATMRAQQDERAQALGVAARLLAAPPGLKSRSGAPDAPLPHQIHAHGAPPEGQGASRLLVVLRTVFDGGAVALQGLAGMLHRLFARLVRFFTPRHLLPAVASNPPQGATSADGQPSLSLDAAPASDMSEAVQRAKDAVGQDPDTPRNAAAGSVQTAASSAPLEPTVSFARAWLKEISSRAPTLQDLRNASDSSLLVESFLRAQIDVAMTLSQKAAEHRRSAEAALQQAAAALGVHVADVAMYLANPSARQRLGSAADRLTELRQEALEAIAASLRSTETIVDTLRVAASAGVDLDQLSPSTRGWLDHNVGSWLYKALNPAVPVETIASADEAGGDPVRAGDADAPVVPAEVAQALQAGAQRWREDSLRATREATQQAIHHAQRGFMTPLTRTPKELLSDEGFEVAANDEGVAADVAASPAPGNSPV